MRSVPACVRSKGLDLLRHWPVSDEKISFEYKLKRFLHGSFMPPEQAHIFWTGTFSEEEKARLFLQAEDRPPKELLERVSSGSATGSNQYFGIFIFPRRAHTCH